MTGAERREVRVDPVLAAMISATASIPATKSGSVSRANPSVAIAAGRATNEPITIPIATEAPPGMTLSA